MFYQPIISLLLKLTCFDYTSHVFTLTWHWISCPQTHVSHTNHKSQYTPATRSTDTAWLLWQVMQYPIVQLLHWYLHRSYSSSTVNLGVPRGVPTQALQQSRGCTPPKKISPSPTLQIGGIFYKDVDQGSLILKKMKNSLGLLIFCGRCADLMPFSTYLCKKKHFYQKLRDLGSFYFVSFTAI